MKLGSYRFKFFNRSLPLLSVMDRYIAAELLLPFLFGVGAFASLGVSIGTGFDLVRKVVESGLPIAVAGQVFLLKLPYFIVYALPMAMLFATLMTYSRLASDSELIALRSCGVSVYRMVVPTIILSLIVTGIAFVFNEEVVPAADYQSSLTLHQAMKEKQPSFQQYNIFFPEYKTVEQPGRGKIKVLSRLFYADQYDGQQMKGLTIIDHSQAGLNQIVVAKSATWNPVQNTWDFYDGTIYVIAPDSSYRDILRFERQQIQLPHTPIDLAEQQSRDYDEMNIGQAEKQLQLLRISGDAQKIRKLEVRIQEKIATPFICVVFGLVGASLGTRPQRTSRATSFGVSVMVIFGYYLLEFISSALGVAGVLPPLISAWLPNCLGLGTAGLLLIRTAQ